MIIIHVCIHIKKNAFNCSKNSLSLENCLIFFSDFSLLIHSSSNFKFAVQLIQICCTTDPIFCNIISLKSLYLQYNQDKKKTSQNRTFSLS